MWTDSPTGREPADLSVGFGPVDSLQGVGLGDVLCLVFYRCLLLFICFLSILSCAGKQYEERDLLEGL